MALLDDKDFAAVTARAIGDIVQAARSGTAIARGPARISADNDVS